MDVRDFIRLKSLSDAELASLFGYDRSYWTHLRLGTKSLGKPAAIKIFRKEGLKVGPISDATDDEIDALERFQGAA